MGVVEFHCAACGVRFAPREGGACGSCGRMICALDLFTVGRGSDRKYLCEQCKQSEPGVRGENAALAVRRRLFKKERVKGA